MLANFNDLLTPALDGGYAVPCFNVFGYEDALAVVRAAEARDAGVILAINLDMVAFMPMPQLVSMFQPLAEALKPYGAGDAFLGNLLMAYLHGGDWESALDRGSAAAAIVVSSRGCASAMPKTDAVIALQTGQSMIPESNWR